MRAAEKEMENAHLRLTFSGDGTVQVFDKDVGQELFRSAGGARGVVLEDPSDTWSHNDRAFTHEIGAGGNGRIAYGVCGGFSIISPTLRSVSTSIVRSLPL